ncbi:DUF2268 domain-containing putative Zn-dependent protease [Pseudalkalibacillus sp. SCS-8]|uniref:DUF2268 domain-containing putative Zn-dependent protease n=1 Tax=Pseudalkalibacillus nanhaiensis TaxID=3115291 RepID=UPI0032DB749F
MNKFRAFFLISIVVLIISSACEKAVYKPSSEEENIIYSFENEKTNQKFTIVHAYKSYNEYLTKLAEKDEDIDKVYKEQIIEPVYERCFKDGEYIHMAMDFITQPPTQLHSLKELVNKIDEEETNTLIRESLIKSSNLLEAEGETTVCIFPVPNVNSVPMVTVGTGKIIVFYNPTITNDILRAVMAHEYHHSYWTEKHYDEGRSFSVLDNLIFEGKAVMFEKQVYPDITHTPIYPEYNHKYWSQVESYLDTHDFTQSLTILRGGNLLPSHYGYSEGYKMVANYLEQHPNLKPEDWTALDAKEIFEKGEYEKNYE